MKRLISSALVALLAFSVQTAYSAPTRSTQIARALWCCSTRCNHARSTAAANHCCGVRGEGSDVVAAPQTKLLDGRALTHVAPVVIEALPILDPVKRSRSAGIPASRARGAPLFLVIRSLRI